MVRFSDIISTRPKKKPENVTSDAKRQSEKLWVSDSQIIEARDTADAWKPVSTTEHKSRVKEYHNALHQKAIDVRNRVKRNQGISPSPVISILHHIIEEDLIDELYEYCASVLDADQPAESISITAGSLKVGKGLGYDTENLIKLGLAAFLKNVGLYKIPDRVLQQVRKLNNEEMEMIRSHPEMGAQIVGTMGAAYMWLPRVIRQVHERSDGSGYPDGLKGEEISELSSIIGIIDIYMAMTKDRPYRNKFLQTDAVKSVIGIEKNKMDVFELFCSKIRSLNVSDMQAIALPVKYPRSSRPRFERSSLIC